MKKKRLSLAAKLNLEVFRAVFWVLSRVRPVIPANRQLGKGSKALFFSTAGIGDTLLDSPAIRSFAQTFEGIEIHAVAHHKRRVVCEHNPFIHKVHSFSKGPVAFWRILRQLQNEGPWDAILYLSCLDPEARCLGYLLNAGVTAGLAFRTKLPWLCAYNLDGEELRRAHLSRQALCVAGVFGARQDVTAMVYAVRETERAELQKILAESGMPMESPVTLQVGGGGAKYRDWPAENYVELLQRLHAMGERGPFFLLGGKDHIEKGAWIWERVQGLPVWNLVGKLSLPHAAALLERSKCVVSTDTGMMHMAFALAVPTVALLHWSPGSRRIGPLANQERVEIIELPRPQPDDDPWQTPMNLIESSEVAERVLRLLAKFPGREKEFLMDWK